MNPDGEIRDTFKKLTNVFEMEEEEFFLHYSSKGRSIKTEYLQRCLALTQGLRVPEEELPFSNVYMASVLSKQIPEGALIHLGMSNTVRAWSMFEFPAGVASSGNTGCRGIDGVLSAFLGAALVDSSRLCFCVLGDLTFFYDMNALTNERLGSNVRILLVNDNGGGLMKTSGSAVHQFVGDADADGYLVAKGHFGGRDSGVVRAYAEGLGFEYLSASDKSEFNSVCVRFLTPEITDRPMLFEVFTNDYDERAAFDRMSGIDASAKGKLTQKAKQVLGPKGVRMIKRILRPSE